MQADQRKARGVLVADEVETRRDHRTSYRAFSHKAKQFATVLHGLFVKEARQRRHWQFAYLQQLSYAYARCLVVHVATN